jgi:hypothetical protein
MISAMKASHYSNAPTLPIVITRYFQKIGSKGGRATVSRMTEKERKELGKRLAVARIRKRVLSNVGQNG